MDPRATTNRHFWWSGDRSERFWIEQLRTDELGDKLIAPNSSTYTTMHGVEVGDIIFRWYSERHPEAGATRGGIYAVSRAIGRVRPSAQLWEGQSCLEIPVTRRTLLRRPILLNDLKRREDEFRGNRDSLAGKVSPLPLYSPWQFPATGLKPMTRYLTKLTAEDVEVIAADHPHVATAMTSA
ncbi:hypothetical protein ACTXKZ_14565 [Brachybacterium alimentarium]|uniref:hypothetical protein n=1 Tax=Brachybacterium alimentarium TaxID=47845 RepID=UPI003FD1362A